jgi:flagellar basal-body rod modification protein FlgD
MSMMSAKLNTKVFGNTATTPTSTNSAPNNLSAEDMKKLGGENVGEVLNKMSDANWVDPAKKSRAVGNDKLDKDAFFKLMLTQMKNQDPTNPLKSHEMAAQLASFSSLEQMQNINKNLEELKRGQKPIEQFQTLNFIGKAVSGDAAKVTRAKGDKDHDFIFSLPQNSNDTKIMVRNSENEIVRTYDLKALKQGSNRVTWNGLDDKSNPAPAGDYQFEIVSKNFQGQQLGVKTDFDGVITGVNYSPEGPVLMVGNQSVRLRDVKKIIDPSLMKNDQKLNNVSEQDLRNAGQVQQTDSKQGTESEVQPVNSAAGAPNNATAQQEQAGAPDAPPKSKLLDQVGLSSAMMAKVTKEAGL